MSDISKELLEFLHTVDGVEDVDLAEAVGNATAKFNSRLKANKRVGKRLTPSKYLKKYGNRWHNLKEEVDTAESESKPSLSPKYTKKTKETAEVRRAGVVGSWHGTESVELDEAKGMTPTKAKKEERIAKNRTLKNKFRDIVGKMEMRASTSGVPHTASGKRMTFESVNENMEQIDELSQDTYQRYSDKADGNRDYHKRKEEKHRTQALRNFIDKKPHEDEDRLATGHQKIASKRWRGMGKAISLSSRKDITNKKEIGESVIPSKGNKKDKRADIVSKELPTMPAGMNAGMRMMPEETLKEEVLNEISQDKIYGAYKERYTLAKAYDTVGNKKEAQKNAHKALKHAEYHASHKENREKYAKVAAARAEIAKRAKPEKKVTPEKETKVTKPTTKKGSSKKSTPSTKTEE